MSHFKKEVGTLVNILRSNEYRQVKYTAFGLKSGEVCLLGLFSKCLVRSLVHLDTVNYIISFYGHDPFYFDTRGIKKHGFSSPAVANMNDSGTTFEQFADMFEEQFLSETVEAETPEKEMVLV